MFMSILELCIISIGLAMDAFAVSICKGLSVKKLNFKHMLIVGGYFGAKILKKIPDYILKMVFICFLIYVSYSMIF